ncbi:hypothetical protein LCGC14_2569720 [marine sediment metagenome]|uniref:Uncharacterized protein n=1 Tax=marine sediment metagenome TaxID=412755 RepID=A0A0F9AHI7_9ZZZZ
MLAEEKLENESRKDIIQLSDESRKDIIQPSLENKIDSKMDSKEKLSDKVVPNLHNFHVNITQPSLENKIEIMKLVMDAARLFKETTPGASADYCLNWAKKRLSGKNNGNSYTPIMNLLEAPNNEEE